MDCPELKWTTPVICQSRNTGNWYYVQKVSETTEAIDGTPRIAFYGFCLQYGPGQNVFPVSKRAKQPCPKKSRSRIRTGVLERKRTPDIERVVMLGKLEGVIHG